MGLHKLRVLNLENNQLTSSSLQTAVRTPLKLTALSLAHNKLTTVPMWICEHCGYGEPRSPLSRVSWWLFIERCPGRCRFVRRVLPRTLERLYLDHNAIRELPPQIANLRSLRFLTLSHNQLQHVQPALQLPVLVGAEQRSSRHPGPRPTISSG